MPLAPQHIGRIQLFHVFISNEKLVEGLDTEHALQGGIHVARVAQVLQADLAPVPDLLELVLPLIDVVEADEPVNQGILLPETVADFDMLLVLVPACIGTEVGLLAHALSQSLGRGASQALVVLLGGLLIRDAVQVQETPPIFL